MIHWMGPAVLQSVCGALQGIFGKDQSDFQTKTLLVLLPGVPDEVVPEDLYRL
jgi:hypothetical protein